MINISRQAKAKVIAKENPFKVQARKYLNINGITEGGYGYIAIPVSGKIRNEIDKNYLTLFAVKGEEFRTGRDTAFIVSKDFHGETIVMDQPHIRLAIGPRGSNLVRLITSIDRRVKFITA